MKTTHTPWTIFRMAGVLLLIMAGLCLITATSEEEEDSAPDSREKGIFSIVATRYEDSADRLTRENTSKFDEASVLVKSGDVYFDDAGNLIRQTEDSDGDGVVDSSVAFTYNSENRKILTVDETDDGDIEAAKFYYDGNGNLIQRDADLSYDMATATFTTDQQYFYEYTAIGGKWKMSLEQFDQDADGAIDYTNVFTYNADGNLARLNYFFGDEEEPYSTSSYTYVNVGGEWYVQTAGTDLDNNGETDFSYAYDYDENGNQTIVVGLIGDVESGEVVTATYSYYHTDNKLIKTEFDEDGDSKFESVVYYEYGDDGKLKSTKTDYDNNGKGEEFDLTYNYTYKTIKE